MNWAESGIPSEVAPIGKAVASRWAMLARRVKSACDAGAGESKGKAAVPVVGVRRASKGAKAARILAPVNASWR